jgi:hypothetical protein
MTWRRFSALLRGLGPKSATVTRAVYRRASELKGETTISDSATAERTFNAMFQPPSTQQ